MGLSLLGSCYRFRLNDNIAGIAIVASFDFLFIRRLGGHTFNCVSLTLLANYRDVLFSRQCLSGVLWWKLHILLQHLKSIILFIKIQLGLINRSISAFFRLSFDSFDFRVSRIENQIIIHLFYLFVKSINHIFLCGHLSQTFIMILKISGFFTIFNL